MGPDGKLVLLRGMHSYPPQTVSTHQMEADLWHGDIERPVELRISKTRVPQQSVHPDILALLERHQGDFGEIPPSRPPDHGFEHTIELEDGVNTLITTPYRQAKAF